MKISRPAARTFGSTFATALHECKNVDERSGVLNAKNAFADLLSQDSHATFAAAFNARLDLLEPLSFPRNKPNPKKTAELALR